MYKSMLNDAVFDVLPTSVDIAPHDKVGVSGTHLFNTPDPTITKHMSVSTVERGGGRRELTSVL